MAKVKYVGPMDPDGITAIVPDGSTRFVSGITGTIIEIPDEYVENFTHPGAPSGVWEPSDKAAKDIHAALVKAAAPADGKDESEPTPKEG